MATASAARTRDHAQTDDQDDGDWIRTTIARLPLGKPLTKHEAARISEARAERAAGVRGASSDEVLSAARAQAAP